MERINAMIITLTILIIIAIYSLFDSKEKMVNKLIAGDIDGVPIVMYNQNPYVGNKKIDFPFDNILGAKYTLFKNSETIQPWLSLTGKATQKPDNYEIGYHYQPGIYSPL